MNRRLLCVGACQRLAVVLSVSLATCAVAATSASAALTSHGQLLHLRSNTNSSSNWFGYNQGTLEQGSKLFNLDHGGLDRPDGDPAHRWSGRGLI